MAGPWEQYAPAAQSGPWSNYAQPSTSREVPQVDEAGNLIYSDAIPAPRREQGFVERYLAPIVEVPAAIATALPATVAGGWASLLTSRGKTNAQMQEEAARIAERLTYKPASETSQDILQSIGGFTQALKLPPAAPGAGTLGAPRVSNQLMSSAVNALAQEAQLARAAAQPVLDVARAAQQKTKAGVQKAATSASGFVLGKSPEILDEALEAGRKGTQSFIDSLRGKTKVEDILTDAKLGVQEMQRKASEAYKTAKSGWSASTKPLSFEPIDEALANLKASLQEKGKWKIGKAERDTLNQIEEVINEWRQDPTARTALDLDALKQRLDATYPESPKHTQAQRAATTMSNAVKKVIADELPEYTDAMKNYSQQLQLIRDIDRALGTGDKVAKETAISRLLTLAKDSPKGEFKRDLAQAVKDIGGVDLMPAIAGQELQGLMPTGFGRLSAAGAGGLAYLAGHPAVAAGLALTSSPRLVGETYLKLGQLGRGVSNLRQAVGRAGTAPANYMIGNMTPEQILGINMLAQAQAQAQAREQAQQSNALME